MATLHVIPPYQGSPLIDSCEEIINRGAGLALYSASHCLKSEELFEASDFAQTPVFIVGACASAIPYASLLLRFVCHNHYLYLWNFSIFISFTLSG